LSFVKLALRVVLVTVIVAYFLVAAGLLVARYYVLPRVDQWRPDIEKALSQAVGTPVSFDAVSADWGGLNANLTLTNLTIKDDDGVAQLGIPKTQAILSWRSILSMEPIFRYIGLEDVIVVARRAPDGTIFVGGFDVSAESDTPFWQSDTMRWLLAQGRLNVADSRLVWVDQQDSSIPLVFQDIDITADNGLLGHQLDLRVTLPPELGGQLEAVAQIDAVAGSFSRLLANEPDGYIYASVSELYPQRLSPWIDIPDVQGSFAGRIWLDVQSGKFTNFSMTTAGRDVVLGSADVDQDGVTLEQFRWRANGPLAMFGADIALEGMVQSLGSLQRVSSSLTVANGQFRLPSAGMQPIEAKQLSAELNVSRPESEHYKIDVQDLTLSNDDGLVTARGSWSTDEASADKSGKLDMNGTLARFKLPRLHHYMPDAVNPEARQWLARAFVAGSVPRASFEINGAVDDFPYGTAEEPGTFRINGNVQDVSIDFANEPGDIGLPWPVLSNLMGTLDLVNDRIGLDVSAGALTLPKGARITLSDLSAKLVDFDRDPVLTINSRTKAQADDYLALFDDTALKDLAPAFVGDFKGKGMWDMPLSLRVPIDTLEQTTFEARLAPNGGEVAYASSPTLTNVQGVAILSEKGFVADALTATLLGGEVQISGGINETLDTIKANGKLSWSELGKFTQSGVLSKVLQGDMSYDITAKVADDGFDVEVSSDLVGTNIALPAPLGLTAGRKAATKVSWKGSLEGNKPDTWAISIANRVSMSANSKPGGATFFNGVQLAIGGAKPFNGSGFTVAAELPSLNLDDWMPVIDTVRAEMNEPGQGESTAMPALSSARLSSKQVTMGDNHLDDVTAVLTIDNGRQYHVELKSAQTNGDVHWALDRGRLQNGFQVRLDRLNIGNRAVDEGDAAQKIQKADKAALPEPGQLSNLPELDIEVDNLSVYGARLGSFNIKGRNSADKKQWQITELRITNPHAELQATGSCRFDDNPGTSLDAELNIADLGELAKSLDQGEPVRKGRGTIKANIEWSRLPWSFDYEGLSGKAELALKEGVFDDVDSSSARVLELLSLQSLNRLLSADLNADESFRDGFPWSAIDGTFDINKGVVATKDLAVNSPVATISLEGNSSLVDETWDLRAVVRPNLDMSGTALATGFLVNPIVGLSALVGQFLLRNPVEAALSQRFSVGGTWEKPEISGSGANPNGTSDGADTQGSDSQSSNSQSSDMTEANSQLDNSDLYSGK